MPPQHMVSLMLWSKRGKIGGKWRIHRFSITHKFAICICCHYYHILSNVDVYQNLVSIGPYSIAVEAFFYRPKFLVVAKYPANLMQCNGGLWRSFSSSHSSTEQNFPTSAHSIPDVAMKLLIYWAIPLNGKTYVNLDFWLEALKARCPWLDKNVYGTDL